MMVQDWSNRMDIKELQKIIQENGVVGAGGAGFPTYVKVDERANTILMNCAECEPLLKLHRQLLKVYAKCLLSFKFLSVWGKLFRRELFINKAKNDIPSMIKVGEDFLMNLKTLENIKGKVALRKINKYSYNANSKNSIQRTQKFDYDYEKTMVIHVESIITRLPFYQTLRHTLFQWKMTYLSGMIANNYQVLYDDDWIVALLKEADKERLSLRNRITIRAVNGNTFSRLILVQCRRLEDGIRTLLYR